MNDLIKKNAPIVSPKEEPSGRELFEQAQRDAEEQKARAKKQRETEKINEEMIRNHKATMERLAHTFHIRLETKFGFYKELTHHGEEPQEIIKIPLIAHQEARYIGDMDTPSADTMAVATFKLYNIRGRHFHYREI